MAIEAGKNNNKRSIKTKLTLSIKFQTLLHRIRNNDPKLIEIDLVNAQIGPRKSSILSRALLSNTHVKTLWLTGNRLGDIGCCHLFDMIHHQKLKTIRHVILGENDMGVSGMTFLAEKVLMDPKCRLEVICLGGNAFGDEGVGILSRALSMNQSLVEVWLRMNRISCQGAKTICDAIVKNCQMNDGNGALKEVWLGGNDIKDDGALAFANLLCLKNHHQTEPEEEENIPTAKGLSVLDLSDNQIGDEGGAALVNSLKLNHQMAKLDLKKNECILDDTIMEKIKGLLEINRSKDPIETIVDRKDALMASFES